MSTTGLRQVLVRTGSIKVITWIFATFVFGSYVASLVAALCESIGYYGPWRLFTTAHLADMVLPIDIAMYTWIFVSVLLFVSPLANSPIRWGNLLAGILSLGSSILAYGALATTLSTIHVPWFVGFLDLPDSAKFLVGGVSVLAWGYVVLSPLLWDKDARSEVRRRIAVLRPQRPLIGEG